MNSSPSGNDISLRAIVWAWAARSSRALRHCREASGGFFLNLFRETAQGLGVAFLMLFGMLGGIFLGSASLAWLTGLRAPLSSHLAPLAGLLGLAMGSGLIFCSLRHPAPGAMGALVAAWRLMENILNQTLTFGRDTDAAWQASAKDWATAIKLALRPWMVGILWLGFGLGVLGVFCGFLFLSALGAAKAFSRLGAATRAAKLQALSVAREWTAEGRSGDAFARDEKRQLKESLPPSNDHSRPPPRL